MGMRVFPRFLFAPVTLPFPWPGFFLRGSAASYSWRFLTAKMPQAPR